MSSADSTNHPLADSAPNFVAYTGEESTPVAPVEGCCAAIESLFENSMTVEEAACFEREMAVPFVPLTEAQTRLLPPHVK